MGVDGYALRVVEGVAHDDVGCFAGHAGQSIQLGHSLRNLAVVLSSDDVAGGDDSS